MAFCERYLTDPMFYINQGEGGIVLEVGVDGVTEEFVGKIKKMAAYQRGLQGDMKGEIVRFAKNVSDDPKVEKYVWGNGVVIEWPVMVKVGNIILGKEETQIRIASLVGGRELAKSGEVIWVHKASTCLESKEE